MTNPTPPVVTSTAQLNPAGVLGYAKAIAAFVAAVLASVVPFLPIDSNVAKYVQIAIAVCGVIAVFAVPNAVSGTRVG